MELIRSFAQLTNADLPLAGGKGVNLGALTRARLPVPQGFVVLTTAYKLFVRQAGIQDEIARIAGSVDADSQESLDTASEQIRSLFARHPVPKEITDAITAAYAVLGNGPVAVRSSATAEDLPDASFAGQQDTYLNIAGPEQVVQAVKRCWSSLWTGRALAYRARNAIAPGDVALAAVVQRLVAADVAGVLFTVDPVSGHRGRMVIDGAWGLGESVVSGLVSPDHWLVDAQTGTVLSETVATKTVMTVQTATGTAEQPVPADMRNRPVLDAAQVVDLIDLGRRTAQYFGAPQDIEWAIADQELYLLQSRPVTTLFPMPEPHPGADAGVRLYVTLAGFQGVMEPLTPATLAIFRRLVQMGPKFLGLKVPPESPTILAVAAGRIYIDVTGLLNSQSGRSALSGDTLDSAMGQAVQDLLSKAGDRLPKATGKRGHPATQISKKVLVKIAGRALRAMVDPHGARRHAKRRVEANISALAKESRQLQTLPERIRFIDKALYSLFGEVVTQTVPLAVVSLVAQHLAVKRLQAWCVDTTLLHPIGRSIPYNPTTEMDLLLWRTACALKAEGVAPSAGHPAVQHVLELYGHRAVREIDVAIPRWREEPAHIIHLLSSYMLQKSADTDPEHHFASGAAAAEKAIAEIFALVRRKHGIGQAAIVHLLLRRFRQLSGVREWHKFYVVHVLAIVRQTLLDAGFDLVKAGRLDKVDDVFYLDFSDLESGSDLRTIAKQNRAAYERDSKRHPVPLAMTSEGEVSYGLPPAGEGALLVGTGASAGVYEGVVRVITDPLGASLAQGEILVAPGTDPAWTPLFLTAGALITETGGMISHGSVVAREYGIPAVVGVPNATKLLRTGQRVRVDGSAGTVSPITARQVEQSSLVLLSEESPQK